MVSAQNAFVNPKFMCNIQYFSVKYDTRRREKILWNYQRAGDGAGTPAQAPDELSINFVQLGRLFIYRLL